MTQHACPTCGAMHRQRVGSYRLNCAECGEVVWRQRLKPQAGTVEIRCDRCYARQRKHLQVARRTPHHPGVTAPSAPVVSTVAVSIAEAGRRLGISRASAYRLVNEGRLRSVKLRGTSLTRIPLSAIDELLSVNPA